MYVAIHHYSIRLTDCRTKAFTQSVVSVSETAHKLLLLQGCYVNGSLHMDDETWQSVQQKNADANTFIAATATVYWPFEEGPFVY